MEREMCSYLEWQSNLEPTNQRREFEANLKVRRDFKGPGPYSNYAVPSPDPSSMPSLSPYGVGSTSAAPSFTGHGPLASPLKSTPHHPSSNPIPISKCAYPSPTSSPEAPDTPEASHSASTSPASRIHCSDRLATGCRSAHGRPCGDANHNRAASKAH